MFKKRLILIVLILGFAFQTGFAENIKFKSSVKSENGNTQILTGILTKPEGDGPFPAVVLLHGCGGIDDANSRDKAWVKRLVSWGYVTLQVDSFRPRGMSNICTDQSQMVIMNYHRIQDAYDANSYLAQIPFVDRYRIAVLGWSHGAKTVLYALAERYVDSSFKAAVAFYPWCSTRLNKLNAPLMILIGESDDWTLSARCTRMMPKEPPDPEVILKIYPGAYHDFDWPGAENAYGYTLKYDPKATADAVVRVKDFLAKHLK
jgi:dienelactone hydrolase